ncbi:MAG: glycosyltransferase [Candidatus Eisenbacteria bacterium]|nr:glycosyltransferase [Candidatus Eisenbacteria bacterium]
MRVLFLADGPRGPLVTGDRLRNWRLVERLARRHRITWWSLQEPGATDPGPAPAGVEARDVRVPPGWQEPGGKLAKWLRALTSPEPLLLMPPQLRGVGAEVERAAADCDVIHVSHLQAWRAVPPSLHRRCVVDLHDSMSLRYDAFLKASPAMRFRDRSFFWYSFLGQAEKLRAYERGMPARAGAAVVVAARDRDHIGSASMRVIPNGVDTEYFRHDGGGRVPGRLVFFGNLRYRPNADAAGVLAREVLPAVRARVPGAHVRLVGADPGPPVQALAGLPGVTLVGWVDDMREELSRAEAFACPLRVASGLQNKVLEALAMELPTVASPTAVAGLELRDGTDLRVCPTGEEFARVVAELLEDPAARARLADSGRDAVRRAYSWDRAAEAFGELYQDVAAAGQPA